MPNFPKLTDCHIKLLRRINDEEGIKVSMHVIYYFVHVINVNSRLLPELSISYGSLVLDPLHRGRL